MLVRSVSRGSVVTSTTAARWDAATRQFHATDFRLALDGYSYTATQRVTLVNPKTGGECEFVRLPGLDTEDEHVYVNKAARLVLVVALVLNEKTEGMNN